MRTFDSGATRDTADGKPDYAGYFSPLVFRAYGEYMLRHQRQTDGTLRASDNWKKGMPKDVCLSSGFRHFIDWWSEHEGCGSRDGMIDALCGLIFNASAYLHEYLKAQETVERGCYTCVNREMTLADCQHLRCYRAFRSDLEHLYAECWEPML